MFLKKKDIKALNNQIHDLYGWERFFHPKKDQVELRDNLYYKNNKPFFFLHNNQAVPLLQLLQDDNPLPKVTIDQPAVPFIVKGADLMRPGIIDMEDFEKNTIVCIVDERNKKAIALGVALFSSAEMQELDKGKVITVIHYVGDTLWKLL